MTQVFKMTWFLKVLEGLEESKGLKGNTLHTLSG